MSLIDTVIRKRLAPHIDVLRKCGATCYYIGGGSLIMDTPNDVDIFPHITATDLNERVNTVYEDKIVSRTKNATTFIVNNTTYQLCNYTKQTSRLLAESFDFSHIQIAALISNNEVQHIDYTTNFAVSRILGTTQYVGSEYPLSSLIRLNKYSQRGLLPRGAIIYNTLNILIDIVRRGFHDYEDFKDQLDAVDLGITELNDTNAIELFSLLTNNKAIN